MDANTTRYSESQVLCGLHEVLPHLTFDAETRIDQFMGNDMSWEELELDEFVASMERFFGFRCDLKAWDQWLGFDVWDQSVENWNRTVAPRLTFGALARFISERIEGVSFAPARIMGRQCGAAGAFLGTRQLYEQTWITCPRIAPSTRIIDVLRGRELDEFWSKLRWITQHSVPELPHAWRDVRARAFRSAFFNAVLAFAAMWFAGGFTMLAVTLGAGIVMYVIASAYQYAMNPLPEELVTFRDLARLIAGSECDAVAG